MDVQIWGPFFVLPANRSISEHVSIYDFLLFVAICAEDLEVCAVI